VTPPAPPAEGRGGRAGAVIVDPANLPSVLDPDPQKNPTLISICSGADNARGRDASCSVVLKYGMKRDFNAYLGTLGASAPVKSLAELRAFNQAHARERRPVRSEQPRHL